MEIEESDSMAYGLLLKDASLFSSSFSKLSYSHTKRDDNKVAHILARLVVNYPKCTVWIKDVSYKVLNFVQADIVVLI